MYILQAEPLNMNSIPEKSLNWELKNVHPLIKRLLFKQCSKRSNRRLLEKIL